ncbi:Six-hairpin glycosidase-like protein [Zopfochytrium polystomum]|nr:Six-hairpin glycosidase-like protein [Zopfochytrium polystomum]
MPVSATITVVFIVATLVGLGIASAEQQEVLYVAHQTAASIYYAQLRDYLSSPPSRDVANFLHTQTNASLFRLLENLEPGGTVPGTVVASPSRSHPDYWFHWVRDAALVMNSVVKLFARAMNEGDQETAKHYEALLWRYAELENKHQGDASSSGLSEPKFNVDGSAFTGPWGRPQHDGPSLRAATLASFAKLLIKEDRFAALTINRRDLILDIVWRDLHHVMAIWQSPGFDLWEETFAQHSYTLGAHHAAFWKGAELAAELGDSASYLKFAGAARRVEEATHSFWCKTCPFVQAAREIESGPSKTTQLDVAPVLAALHMNQYGIPDNSNAVLSVTSGPIWLTAIQLASTMKLVFPLNHAAPPGVAPAIGRYPEDTYDGYETSARGNPWFLATNALAELCFEAARKWATSGCIEASPALLTALEGILDGQLISGEAPGAYKGTPLSTAGPVRNSWLICRADQPEQYEWVIGNLTVAGDAYIRRVMQHVPQKESKEAGYGLGSISEQFNRASGMMQGAIELTWSHASLLTASWSRSALALLVEVL